MKKSKMPIIIAIVGVIATMIMIIGVVNLPKGKKENNGKIVAMSDKDADKSMSKHLSKIKVNSAEKVKGTVDYSDNAASNLPNIDTKYPLTVLGYGDVDIEIFSTSEKAGKGNNGWLNEIA
ncbi:MAG: hypothetical protein K6A79_08765, partial [Ruminococcus sp.]|nr:hypothetical protein [Ruminococcus sp.]